MNPIKILELRASDWMKGISAHAGLPVGGIFQTADQFDPFSLPAYFRGSIAPTDVDNTTLSTEINSMASGSSAGVGYVMALGNRASGGAKCVYRIKTSDNTVTDFQASVNNNTLLEGCAIYGGYFIYGDGTSATINSTIFPTIGGNTTIENSISGLSTTYQPIVFRVGPSGYLHYIFGSQAGKVGVITVPSSNSANNTDDSVVVQTDLTPKDAVSDGRYLVVIADNNPSQASGVTSDCKVFYTVPAFSAGVPTSTTVWEVAHSIPDQYLIAVRYVGGHTYVIGYSGIWEVGIGMAPQLVMPLLPSQLPLNPYSVDITNNNVMIWQGKATGARVYAFGNPFFGKPILYTPYDSDSSTRLGVALCTSGDYVYAGLDATGSATKVVAHNWGTTRANATISTITQHLSEPFSLSKVKVTLKKPLASGEEINIQLFNANDEEILTTSSRTFTTYGALRTMVFEPAPGSTPIPTFENYYITVNAVGGAIVDTVQVWAKPITALKQTK